MSTKTLQEKTGYVRCLGMDNCPRHPYYQGWERRGPGGCTSIAREEIGPNVHRFPNGRVPKYCLSMGAIPLKVVFRVKITEITKDGGSK